MLFRPELHLAIYTTNFNPESRGCGNDNGTLR
jgi:hypothetical protein